ncbi:proline--tRNA ligase [Leptospira montravelensis]|uniref:Proline--tRNA ligase n=1 Tax=Leptospira montravelensis TaxID=2484961 RepID=A0ABY2LVP7_9LEPT|nr:proline--tRNA ligase [Leptospira montravelensis]TGK78009.1 proline--tRNA ligase [Leptospira montravelensis]TGL03945.1 proline--tRNA ligase [Leptospira montravelensis]
MKASSYLIPTAKEDPQDAVVASHKLMTRAGLIRKSAAGLYSYLPLGLRILKKIEGIVRSEMDRAGALEFQLPILTPSEIWKESGRWDKMGKEMFRLKDRHDNESCLGPTHEESFCVLVKPMVRSYKDLPINVYQIHTKFRDEIRPRFGVIRSREFTMKDAYSFHLDDESLDKTYQTMRKTYRRIFAGMGLSTIPVQADSGNMGGSASEEFMVVSPIGEETLTICPSCQYSGNIEKTPVLHNEKAVKQAFVGSDKIHTPSKKSIAEVAEFLKTKEENLLKAVALWADGTYVLVFLEGDRELNENKLKNHLACNELRPMGPVEMEKLGLVPGFIGPGFPKSETLKVFVDSLIDWNFGYISGANEVDYHIAGVKLVNFFKEEEVTKIDVSQAKVGDPCPNCGTGLTAEKGIEVGHIFKLGQKYSKAFDITVLNDKGKATTTTMGCYGIGVNRCMATVIEQCNDDKGIFWPVSIAPFTVCLVSIAKNPDDIAKIDSIYKALVAAGIEVLWDDRDLGPGFKFKDSELIGFPIRLTLGKGFLEKGEITILDRKSMAEETISFTTNEDLVARLQNQIKTLQTALQVEVERAGT